MGWGPGPRCRCWIWPYRLSGVFGVIAVPASCRVALQLGSRNYRYSAALLVLGLGWLIVFCFLIPWTPAKVRYFSISFVFLVAAVVPFVYDTRKFRVRLVGSQCWVGALDPGSSNHSGPAVLQLIDPYPFALASKSLEKRVAGVTLESVRLGWLISFTISATFRNTLSFPFPRDTLPTD